MKMNFFNGKSFKLFLSAALIVSTLFVSCDKNDDDDMTDKTYSTSGNANGSQMSPSTTSTGTGTLTGTYNARTNVWQYNISWANLSTTAGLVQVYGPAGTGVNAALLFPLSITTPGASGSASGSITLTDAQETALLANTTYYTVSSTTYPSGEIRGQVTATAN
jgi:CHRD domain